MPHPVPPAAGPARVVVVGSVNEDRVIRAPLLPGPGETVVGTGSALLPGGKGANQAVAAARAGALAVFVGAVGDDDAGKRSLAHLRRAGVGTGEVVTVPATATGSAVVVVSDEGENQIVIVAGANGALDGAHVVRAMERLRLTAADVCLVGFEIGDDAVSATARCASRSGCRLLVNPAPARSLPHGLAARAPVLVPNASEARLLTGEPDERSAARALAALTGAPVVVTLGAGGVLVVEGTREELVPSPRVSAVDTTGAGDTLAGVLAAGLADGLGLVAAVRRAAVAAALSVTRKGARDGMPDRAQIEEFTRRAPS